MFLLLLSFYLFIYLFIYLWLHQVLVVARGIFRCGAQALRCGARASF